jgi:AraC-like DNA-binding protein
VTTFSRFHGPAFHNLIGMAMVELRRGERAIGDLALACGFVSLSSFNRQFKRQTGLAPREWRKNGKSL